MRHSQLSDEIKRREYYNSMAPFPVFDTDVISDIKKLKMITAKEGFENEPITYCKTCLSIHIKTIKFDKGLDGENREVDYCVPCGNTDLDTVFLSEWEDLYQEKYGERFLTDKKE